MVWEAPRASSPACCPNASAPAAKDDAHIFDKQDVHEIDLPTPTGTLVMESTPMGASGCFWNQWRDAKKTGTIQHFFPWWLEPAYAGEPVPEDSLSDEERNLMHQPHELTLSHIAFRRQLRAKFRSLAQQEYAEDAEHCNEDSGRLAQR